MTIPISEFFKVTTKIETGGVVVQDFGRGLLLTTNDSISAGGSGKYQYFTDYDAVIDVFPSDSEPAKAAAKWFGFDPYPQGLYIGRWADTNINTILEGKNADALADLTESTASFRLMGVNHIVDLSGETTYAAIASAITTAITTPGYTGQLDPDSITITVDNDGSSYAVGDTLIFSAPTNGGTAAIARISTIGTSGAIATIDFTSATAITAGATLGSGYGADDSTITIASSSGSGTSASFTATPARLDLVPGLNGATMTFADNRFTLELGSDDVISPPYFEPHSDGSGADISVALGFSQADNPIYRQGSDGETAVEAINTIGNLVDQRATYLMLDDGIPAEVGDVNTIESVWALAEASDYIFAFTDTSSDARLSGDTTSLLARANSAQLGNTLPCVADADKTIHVGALAGLSSINWNQPASIITLFGKTLPGIAATGITPTELGNIQAKRGNVYSRVGGLPTFIEGTMARNGYWSDAVAFNLWMKNELELNIWNALRASRRLTIAILGATIDSVMEKGVRNGGIQPGRTVSNSTKADIISTTGNNAFDGILQAGYLVYIGSLADLTQTDIDNRLAPPIKIWASGSEAIHQANVDLIFSN